MVGVPSAAQSTYSAHQSISSAIESLAAAQHAVEPGAAPVDAVDRREHGDERFVQPPLLVERRVDDPRVERRHLALRRVPVRAT